MRRLVCTLALLLVAQACSRDSEAPVAVPLPALPDGPIEVRVAYLVNPRFPASSGEELSILLESAAQTVKAHFGREVRFTTPEVLPIEAYFGKLGADARKTADGAIYDFKRGKGDRRRLARQMEKDLRSTGDDLDAMIAYARPYLLTPVMQRSHEALAEALVTTQLERVKGLAAQRAGDGEPVLDAAPFNEVVYWDMLRTTRFPYEVIVTNQLIASVEYAMNSVHSALRGGITNGFTTANPGSRYNTTAIVSVYPFVSEDPVVRALRGNESYTRADALRYAGVLLAHEIGHQLWHLGHPYGRTACVMAPTPLLRFRPWVEGLVPAQCPFSSTGPMAPGVAKIYGWKPD